MKLTFATLAVAFIAATSASAGISASGALSARDIADGVPTSHIGKVVGYATKSDIDGRDVADFRGQDIKEYGFSHTSATVIAAMPVSR